MVLSKSDLNKLSKEATNQLQGFFHEKVESKVKVLDVIFSRFIQGIHQLHNDEMYYHLDEEFKLNYSKHVNVKFQNNVQNILDNHHDMEIKSIESLKQAMNVFCTQIIHEAKTEVCQKLDKLFCQQFNVVSDTLSELHKTYNEKLVKCRTSNYIEIKTAVSVERTISSDIRKKEFLKNGEKCQTLRNAIHATALDLEAEKSVKEVLNQEIENLKQHCGNLKDTIQRQQEQQNANQAEIYEHKKTISVLKSVVSEYIKYSKETEVKMATFEKQLKRTEHRMTRNFFQGDSNLKRIHSIRHRVDLALQSVERLSEDQKTLFEEDDDVSFGKKKRKNMTSSTRTQIRTSCDQDCMTLEASDLDFQQYGDENLSSAINNEPGTTSATCSDFECKQLKGTVAVSRMEIETLRDEVELLQSIVSAKEDELENAMGVMDLMKQQQDAYETLFHSKNLGRILASDSVTRSIPVCDFEDVIFGQSAVRSGNTGAATSNT